VAPSRTVVCVQPIRLAWSRQPVVEPPGVERADPTARGGDHVEHGVVDVVVRVARHRHLGQVGDPGLAVLDLQRRTRGVLHERGPAHLARVGASPPVLPLSGPADLAGHVAHGVVVGPPHRLADGGGLGGRSRELRGERDRLVGCLGQVVGADLARLAGSPPLLSCVRPPGLEQPIQLGVLRRPGRVDARRGRRFRGHVGSPARPAIASRVVRREPSSGARLGSWLVDRRGNLTP